jgi:hypothetical protein
METSVACLEQQPLLRVHGLGLCCRDAERAVVKELRVCDEPTVSYARELSFTQAACVAHDLA